MEEYGFGNYFVEPDKETIKMFLKGKQKVPQNTAYLAHVTGRLTFHCASRSQKLGRYTVFEKSLNDRS